MAKTRGANAKKSSNYVNPKSKGGKKGKKG